MIRAFWTYVKLAFLVIFALWLARQGGTVDVRFGPWNMQTTAGVVVVVLLIFLTVTVRFTQLWRGILYIPRSMSLRRQIRRHERLLEVLEDGWIAIEQGDKRNAHRAAQRAQALAPLRRGTLLLSAEAALLAGDKKASSEYFESLAALKGSEFLGYFKAMKIALDQKDMEEAEHQARLAVAIRPRDLESTRVLLEMAWRRMDWQEADEYLKLLRRTGDGSQESVRCMGARMKLKEAEAANEQGKKKQAIDNAVEALEANAHYLPASIFLSRLLIEQGQAGRAQNHILRAWKQQPLPQLVELWFDAADRGKGAESSKVSLQRVRDAQPLIQALPDHPESLLLALQLDLDANLMGQAIKWADLLADSEVMKSEASMEPAILYAARSTVDSNLVTGGSYESGDQDTLEVLRHQAWSSDFRMRARGVLQRLEDLRAQTNQDAQTSGRVDNRNPTAGSDWDEVHSDSTQVGELGGMNKNQASRTKLARGTRSGTSEFPLVLPLDGLVGDDDPDIKPPLDGQAEKDASSRETQ